MDLLSALLALPVDEKEVRGLRFTPQEIAQQPATWRATHELFRRERNRIAEFLKGAAGAERRRAVFLIGAGTSDYVGRALVTLLRRQWQTEVEAIPSPDLLTAAGDWILRGQSYLWISFSRSGDSPEGVAVIERALRDHPSIHHLVVTCNSESQMLRHAAGQKQMLGIALPDSVHDRGLAMTSSFSNMVVFGQCLAHVDDAGAYDDILPKLVAGGQKFLAPAATLAAELANGGFDSVCFVGSGAQKAVAVESALKVLELTAGKVRTMSESALGLRHGPMAALNQKTLFVAFLSSDERVRRYELDLLEEIGTKRLVRTRVAVSGDPVKDGLAEFVLNVEGGIADDYRPPLDVIFGQLLGLFFSMRRGLLPDCPSPSGAISRVVQNVKIYG